jgi:hypothetical protein
MLDSPTASAARPLARARMMLTAEGLPPALAPHLLAALSAADKTLDDLTESEAARLGRKAAELVNSGAAPDKMAAELAAYIDELLGTDEGGPSVGDTDTVAEPDAVAILDLVAMHRDAPTVARDFIARRVPLSGVIDHYRNRGPSVFQHLGLGDGGGPTRAARLAAALASGIVPMRDPGAGREFAGLGIAGAAMVWGRDRGIRARTEGEALRAVMAGSHTSSDFISTVLGPSVDLALGTLYEQAQPEILRATRLVERNDYRQWNAVRAGAGTMPEPVGEGGEFKFGTIDDEGEAGPVPEIRGRIFRLSEQAIRSDRLDLLGDAARYLARGAAEAVRVGMCRVLAGGGNGQVMRDGNPLFHAGHGNTIGGQLNIASLGAAAVKTRRQTGPGGEALAIAPRFLLVAPEQEVAARQLVAEIDATRPDDVNPFGGRLEVLVEPGLAAPQWYLLADPMLADGLVMSFVDSATPRTEQRIGWGSPVIEWRLRFDVGFGALDWRGMVRSTGT